MTLKCFVSKNQESIIDFVFNGKTERYGATFEQVKSAYPDADEMSFNDFCKWKGERQRTKILWNEIEEEIYFQYLRSMPTECQSEFGFLIGEVYDFDYGNGKPRFMGYRQIGDKYFVGSRPMTVSEFKEEQNA
jgi:hypothetical protein